MASWAPFFRGAARTPVLLCSLFVGFCLQRERSLFLIVSAVCWTSQCEVQCVVHRRIGPGCKYACMWRTPVGRLQVPRGMSFVEIFDWGMHLGAIRSGTRSMSTVFLPLQRRRKRGLWLFFHAVAWKWSRPPRPSLPFAVLPARPGHIYPHLLRSMRMRTAYFSHDTRDLLLHCYIAVCL